MENENMESKKTILGAVIGGCIGMGILYSLYAIRNHKTPIIKKIGRTISEVGELLENCNSPSDIVTCIEDKIPKKRDMFSNLSDWLSQGVSVWKTLKKR